MNYYCTASSCTCICYIEVLLIFKKADNNILLQFVVDGRFLVFMKRIVSSSPLCTLYRIGIDCFPIYNLLQAHICVHYSPMIDLKVTMLLHDMLSLVAKLL